MSMPASLPVSPARHSLGRIYGLELGYELLKLWRLPAFSIPTLLFPALFYVFFGVGLGATRAGEGTSLAAYLLATYGTFGVIGASLFGFGIGVAIERGQGWMLLKRASPMPPGAYLVAKMGVAVVFSGLVLLELYALGALAGGVRLSSSDWLLLAASHLATAVPFSALGLALGYWMGPNSAPAVVNLIYLPTAFLSGLWVPLAGLPGWARAAAPWLPPFHASQLSLSVLEADAGGSAWGHVGYLAALTAASLMVARLGYLRDRDRTWG